MKKTHSKKTGFTIIETMIAITIFLVVTLVGMTSLLNANLVHQQSQNTRELLDSLSFIMEDMSRSLRTGYNYQCFNGQGQTISPGTLGDPFSCSSGWGIAFEQQDGDPGTFADQWIYYISDTGEIKKSTDGAFTFVTMTPPEVKVDLNLSSIYGFSVLGAKPIEQDESGDKQQPLVNIRLVGTITYKNIVTPFSLQTSVSQRSIDI